MTTATVQPRKPKRPDYARVALAAAQASLAKQTAAHVKVLEARDSLSDLESEQEALNSRRAGAQTAYNSAVYELVELLGLSDAAERLDLTMTETRAAHRAGTPRAGESTTSQDS